MTNHNHDFQKNKSLELAESSNLINPTLGSENINMFDDVSQYNESSGRRLFKFACFTIINIIFYFN